jgi:chemotaxis signal transduction protein
MDRNLYERANDCRWWALTSRFREILASDNISQTDRDTMCGILAYINHLYTVYTNLFIYDSSGTIQAVSKPDTRHLIGSKLSESWVTRTLNIHDTQQYCVSAFTPTNLYEDKHTYIYGASILAPNSNQVCGGIGIVFDSEPQFEAMLKDALPKNKRGEIIAGCFGVFTDRKKCIISSTNQDLPIGSTLSINDHFFKLVNGEGCSDIIELDGRYYVVGARMSGGYREYKVSDNYNNDIVALVFVEIGEVGQVSEANTKGTVYADFKYPRSQGTEEVVELSTFMVNKRLFAMHSDSIICSLNNQEITPMVGSDSRCLGLISFMRSTIPVVSLRSELGGEDGYDKDNDCIIITKLKRTKDSEEEIVGLVIDRVMDSPEIPRRCLEYCEGMLYNNFNSMTSHVVQPEQGDERGFVLLVLDMASIARRILDDGENYGLPSNKPLLVSNR